MIIATAGHVDHGKTALVKALTGQETDRTEEERRRGLSIQLGFAWMDLPDGSTLDLVDVPGHARFMRTLVAGVGCVDAVMLVVAADDGVMPQTLEHLQLVSLLELPLALVVISKCALVDQDRIERVSLQIQEQLSLLGLPCPTIHPTDSLSGQGMATLREDLARQAAMAPARPRLSTRMLIDRHFQVSGIGQVVTGTVAQGRLAVGDQLTLTQNAAPLRVRGLQVHGRPTQLVESGQRCAVNLAGDLPAQIERGTQLLDPFLHQPTTRLDVLLSSLNTPLPRELQMHLSGAIVNARLVPLTFPAGLAAGLRKGTPMQVVLAQAITCRLGDRLVLRDPASQRLVAGGSVVNPLPPPRIRRKVAGGGLFEALLEPSAQGRLERLLNLPGMLDLQWYRRITHLPSPDLDAELGQIELCMPLVRVGQGVCQLAQLDGLGQRIRETLAAFHQDQPEKPGLPTPALARRLALEPQDVLMRLAIRRSLDSGELLQRGALLSLADFTARTDSEALCWLERLEPHFAASTPRPPVLGEMLEHLSLERDTLLGKLEWLTARGHLVRVARNRYLSQNSLEELAEVARELTRTHGTEGFTTAAFRDASGVGRNHSVAILESLDRLGLTRRLPGDRRIAD
jgi:selenocysteine-specific elongation factor